MIKRIFKVILAVVITYLVIVGGTILFGILAEEGALLDAWYSLTEYLPFGRGLAAYCLGLFTKYVEVGKDLALYQDAINIASAVDFFGDTCILLLTAVFFEAVNDLVQKIIGVKKKHGVRGIIVRMVCGMVSALLCTLIATYLLQFLYQQLNLMPNLTRGFLSVAVSLGTLAGSVGVAYVALGVSIALAVVFVLFKVVLVNALKVGITYVGILMAVLFLNEGVYLKIFTLFAGWSILLIILIFLDVVVSTLFSRK